jgi:hypothetical protein
MVYSAIILPAKFAQVLPTASNMVIEAVTTGL